MHAHIKVLKGLLRLGYRLTGTLGANDHATAPAKKLKYSERVCRFREIANTENKYKYQNIQTQCDSKQQVAKQWPSIRVARLRIHLIPMRTSSVWTTFVDIFREVAV